MEMRDGSKSVRTSGWDGNSWPGNGTGNNREGTRKRDGKHSGREQYTLRRDGGRWEQKPTTGAVRKSRWGTNITRFPVPVSFRSRPDHMFPSQPYRVCPWFLHRGVRLHLVSFFFSHRRIVSCIVSCRLSRFSIKRVVVSNTEVGVRGSNLSMHMFIFQRHQLARALYRKRVGEGRKSSSLLAIRMKARIVVGRGKKSLLINSDPGFELRLGGRKSAKVIDEMEHKNNNNNNNNNRVMPCYAVSCRVMPCRLSGAPCGA